MLDGNAIGGMLLDIFGADLTATDARCGSCGASALVAELAVYRSGPGTVVRCRSCDGVLMVFAEPGGVIGVDVTGLARLAGPFEPLCRHVASFNAGVRTGDFSAMTEGFTDDAEMIFTGIPAGPFRGRAEIAQAYAAQPPDDTIRLLRCDSPVRADYAWGRHPGVLAGRMDFVLAEGRVRRLTIGYLRD